ncbi:MAG: hypothetical protein H0U10_06660 [Chloroflexia bacterium]|nr:hypothetical protein [Chloroflexia bacterium]
MDERRFDDLAREMTATGTARRGVLKRLVAVAVAGGVARLRGGAVAAAPVTIESTCRGNFCKGDVDRCRGGGESNGCVCYLSPDGSNVCAAPFGVFQRCRTDRDCAEADFRGFRCIQNGRRCAGGDRDNVCAAPCKATRRAIEERGVEVWPKSAA